MRPAIYITQPVADSAISRLREVAEVDVNPDASRIPSKQEIVANMGTCNILFSLLHNRIDSEVIGANPKLRAVTSMSITPDNIDIAAATARKIPVTVVGPHAVESTADIAFGLLLAVARKIPQAARFVQQGGFPGAQSAYFLGVGVHGKTLGLVGGRGRIARAVARRASGFDMRIIYAGPNRMEPGDERQLGMTYVPLETLLQESDFVSVHAAMKPETRHLIGKEQLALMKPSAILVNTARGPIVDEAALVDALRENRIAGAGLDVYENEPEVHPGLFEMDSAVCAPHLGSAVDAVRERMANEVVDNILAIVEGKRPPTCVNPEIYPG